MPKTSAFELGIYGREASVSHPNLVGHVVRSTPFGVFDNSFGTPILVLMTNGLVSPATEASSHSVVLPWQWWKTSPGQRPRRYTANTPYEERSYKFTAGRRD